MPFVSPNGLDHWDAEPLPSRIVAEPIEGWRSWKVLSSSAALDMHALICALADLHDRDPDGNPYRKLLEPRLCAVASGAPWEPGLRQESKCHGGLHDAPGEECSCGYWAVPSREDAETVTVDYRADAFGRVQMWGRVVAHERGWRAQYARPVELFVAREEHLVLGEIYGCPCSLVELPPPEKTTMSPGVIPAQFWGSTALSAVSASTSAMNALQTANKVAATLQQIDETREQMDEARRALRRLRLLRRVAQGLAAVSAVLVVLQVLNLLLR